MAKTYDFKVLFNPCRHIQYDGYTMTEVRIDFGNKYGGYIQFTSTVKDIPAEVEKIANLVGKGEGVSASVYMLNKNERKPAGFDKITRGLQFNVQTFDKEEKQILQESKCVCDPKTGIFNHSQVRGRIKCEGVIPPRKHGAYRSIVNFDTDNRESNRRITGEGIVIESTTRRHLVEVTTPGCNEVYRGCRLWVPKKDCYDCEYLQAEEG